MTSAGPEDRLVLGRPRSGEKRRAGGCQKSLQCGAVGKHKIRGTESGERSLERKSRGQAVRTRSRRRGRASVVQVPCVQCRLARDGPGAAMLAFQAWAKATGLE